MEDGQLESMHAFGSIQVNVHELVSLQENFNLRPGRSQPSVKFSPPQISEAQMDHPRWRCAQNDPFREIGVL
jgi:hypothetical protein